MKIFWQPWGCRGCPHQKNCASLLLFDKKRPKAVVRPWLMLQKIFLWYLKGIYLSYKNMIAFHFYINPWPQDSLWKSFKDIWRTLYYILLQMGWNFVKLRSVKWKDGFILFSPPFPHHNRMLEMKAPKDRGCKWGVVGSCVQHTPNSSQ